MQAAQQDATPSGVIIQLDDNANDPSHELQDVSLFEGLSPEELKWIDREMMIKSKETGEKLMVQGRPVTSIFIIRQGLVDVLINDDRVAQRGPMDSLGEMSCFSGDETASATVVAVTPCQVWEISRMAFMIVIDAIPTLRAKMFSTITHRLKSISHRFSEILKHVPHGIIKVGQDGFITDEFSSRCMDYLGMTQLTGKNLGELLFSRMPVLLESWNETIHSIGQGNISNDCNGLNKLPDEVDYPHPDGKTRIFKLFYHLTEDENKRINGLDIGIDDITESREYQSELSSFQNMMTNLEQLLIMVESKTGAIIQETFSHSQLGDLHFPEWKNLKGKNILETILANREKEELDHFKRWFKMLENPFVLESMSLDELTDLSPRFVFETALGKVMELSFTPNQQHHDGYSEILGKFKHVETEQEPEENQSSTIELMEEVVAAELEHQSGLPEALNEMQISMEIAQSHMTTPAALAANHYQIAGMIHSVKGLGQSFGLNSVAKTAHDLEEILGKLPKSHQDSKVTSQLLAVFKSLLSLIVVSKSLCSTDVEKDLGICRSREPEIRISLSQFQQLKQRLNNILKNEKTDIIQRGESSAFNELANEIQSLEMMKMDKVFPRLQRIVEDTARLLKKQVEFKAADKSSVHMNLRTGHLLNTCLIQLIKNAVYHGIETPTERQTVGKPEKASIRTWIEKKGEYLSIYVQDDGRGISLVKTVNRAVQLEIIHQEKAEQLIQNDQFDDILALLFEPGFSTAESVSLISGRGIGMSLIKTEIESIGGSISVKSREHRGTRFCLRVPVKPDTHES